MTALKAGAEATATLLAFAALSRHNTWVNGLGRFTVPQPHLEDGSVYRQNRPTTLDKIKNFRITLQVGAVTDACLAPASVRREPAKRAGSKRRGPCCNGGGLWFVSDRRCHFDARGYVPRAPRHSPAVSRWKSH